MSVWMFIGFVGGFVIGLWIFEQIRIMREEKGWLRLQALKIHDEVRCMVQTYFAERGLFDGDDYWAAHERLIQWEKRELETALIKGRSSYDLLKEGFNAAVPSGWA